MYVPHPLGVEVFFDWEAVNDAGGGQTELHTGHKDQQQDQLRGSHSVRILHLQARLIKKTKAGMFMFSSKVVHNYFFFILTLWLYHIEELNTQQ